jgi:hypothetical protein
MMRRPDNNESSNGFGGRCTNFIGSGLRMADRYGYPVTFTFDKAETFRSAFGGIMTLISMLGILIYFAVNMSYAFM